MFIRPFFTRAPTYTVRLISKPRSPTLQHNTYGLDRAAQLAFELLEETFTQDQKAKAQSLAKRSVLPADPR